MIATIKHKGLKLFWEKNDPSRLPSEQVRRIDMILDLLDTVKNPSEMNFPGSGYHALKGDLNGFFAVKVTGNWRIIFRFQNEDAYDVDHLDYH